MRLLGPSGIAAAIGVVLVAALSGCGDLENYVAAEGEVYRIDRTCEFTVTSGYSGHKTVKSETDACNATGEFDAMRGHADNNSRRIQGNAKFMISYVSPIDKSTQTGELAFDGGDDEFYSIKAHDHIKILVHKTEPGKIRKL